MLDPVKSYRPVDLTMGMIALALRVRLSGAGPEGSAGRRTLASFRRNKGPIHTTPPRSANPIVRCGRLPSGGARPGSSLHSCICSEILMKMQGRQSQATQRSLIHKALPRPSLARRVGRELQGLQRGESRFRQPLGNSLRIG